MVIRLFVFTAVSALTGCAVTAEVALPRHGNQDSSRVTVAIVMAYVARDVEREAFKCIDIAVRKEFPNIHIISPGEFRPLAFPDLPPEAAIHDPEYLALALGHPKFRERIDSLGIRYLIALRGVTEQKLAGAGAGSVAGLIVWNRNTRLAACVLDVTKSQEPKELEAMAEGNPWLLLLGGVPIMVPASTESTACQALGKAVVNFFSETLKMTP